MNKLQKVALGLLGLSNLRSFYEGGRITKANADFINATSDFEETAKYDRDTMRARARWLAANNPIMSSIDGSLIDNIAGDGITLRSTIVNKKLAKFIEKRFGEWCSSRSFDDDGKINFYDGQQVILRTRFVDGEIFIYKRITEDGLKLKYIEADALDSQSQDGGIIKKDGVIVAYRFKGERLGTTFTVDAKHIINYYKAERTTQDRGISEYAKAIINIKDFSAYQSAVIKSARARASIAYTVKSEGNPKNFGASIKNDERLQTINGIMVYYLNKNESIDKHGGDAASDDYKNFVETTIRLMATARRISYELAFKDYSRVNFASSRASLIQDNYRFNSDQKHLTRYVLNDVFETWLECEILAGRIKVPLLQYANNKIKFTQHSWSYPVKSWVDPLKDMLAIEKELELGITTRTEIAHMRGKDYEDLLDVRKGEIALEEAAGVTYNEKDDSSPTEDLAKLKRDLLMIDQDDKDAVFEVLSRYMPDVV